MTSSCALENCMVLQDNVTSINSIKIKSLQTSDPHWCFKNVNVHINHLGILLNANSGAVSGVAESLHF